MFGLFRKKQEEPTPAPAPVPDPASDARAVRGREMAEISLLLS